MTREQVKELLPVMQAFAEGKEVQRRWQNRHDQAWCDVQPETSFDISHGWRIKPAPREWWLLVSRQTGRVILTYEYLAAATAACEGAINKHRGCVVVHVREVAGE